jgi:hypothetical protein
MPPPDLTPSPASEEDAHQAPVPAARFLDSRSTTRASTTACPNCGRRFAGSYCPSCGQKADAELTISDIIGGFFRDLFDAKHGLWPILEGMTLVPGQTLRHYLSRARNQYVDPGRYLLVAGLF